MSVNNPGDRAGWFWVCVDEATNSGYSGTVQSPYKGPEQFCGLDHFLEFAERAMDEMDFPQADFKRRQFAAKEKETAKSNSNRNRRAAHTGDAQESAPWWRPGGRGKFGTFYIRVLYRRNASWQGQAVFYRGDTAEILMFRSGIELILAMLQALKSERKHKKSQSRSLPPQTGMDPCIRLEEDEGIRRPLGKLEKRAVNDE